MHSDRINRSVWELFDMSLGALGGLTRSEQLQSLMVRLIWHALTQDLDTVVQAGVHVQRRFRAAQPNRSYLAEWDELLGDSERLLAIYRRYDLELSGLYSNTPLLGVISQDDRSEMLKFLREYQRNRAVPGA